MRCASHCLLLSILLALATACGSDATPAPTTDVGVSDATTSDGSAVDDTSGTEDAGPVEDTGPVDDAEPEDADLPDADSEDVAVEDATDDAADPDSGTEDAADAEDSPDAEDAGEDVADAADAVDDATEDTGEDTGEDGGGGGLLCDFGGTGSQDFGDDCGCVDDCDPDSPRCTRNLVNDFSGTSYCTFTCADDDECGDGFQCNPGIDGIVEPFCEECESRVPGELGLGDACRCEADCGSETLEDGRDVELSCVGGVCTVSPCRNIGPARCPEGWTCETALLDSPACVQCLNETPAGEGEACACEDDCESALECISGTCRTPCDDDGDCADGEECREQVTGPSLCTSVPDLCDPARDGGLGSVCRCNAECGTEAPICLTLEVGGVPASLCTVRPCSTSDPDPCPGSGPGSFRCCGIPFVIENTCVPDAFATAIDSFAFCSP